MVYFNTFEKCLPALPQLISAVPEVVISPGMVGVVMAAPPVKAKESKAPTSITARPPIGLSPQDQADFQRLSNRVHLILADLKAFTSTPFFKKVNKAVNEDRVKMSQTAALSSYLRSEQPYFEWFFQGQLQDVQTLFSLGATELARQRLTDLLLLTRQLKALPPALVYTVEQLTLPYVLSVKGDAVKNLSAKLLPRIDAGGLRLPRPTAEDLLWTQAEIEAWQYVESEGLKLASAIPAKDKPISEKEAREILAKFGVPQDRVHWNATETVYFPNDLSNYEAEGLTKFNFYKGHFYFKNPIQKSPLMFNYMVYAAEKKGLIATPLSTPLGTRLAQSYIRNYQLQILIYYFLTNKGQLISSDKTTTEQGYKDLQTDPNVISLGLTPEKIRAPHSPNSNVKTLETASAVPSMAALSKAQRIEEIGYASNGSLSFTNPPPELETIFKLVNNIPAGPALSIGSGEGPEALALASKKLPDGSALFTRVDALDFSYVATQRVAGLHGKVPNLVPIQAIRGDASAYSYSPNTYSFITAINLLEYLPPQQWAGFFKKTSAALLPKGELYIVVDKASGAGYTEVSQREGASLKGTTLSLKFGSEVQTKHFFTKDDINQLLDQTGLKKDGQYEISITEGAFANEKGDNPFEAFVIRIKRK